VKHFNPLNTFFLEHTPKSVSFVLEEGTKMAESTNQTERKQNAAKEPIRCEMYYGVFISM
jgi:hypothetical protein